MSVRQHGESRSTLNEVGLSRNEDLFTLCNRKRTDLLSLWSNNALMTIFPDFGEEEEFENFREKYVITLSILVYIEYPLHDNETAIQDLFANVLENWSDEKLPLKQASPTEEEGAGGEKRRDILLSWLDKAKGQTFARKFLDSQYIFLPCIVELASDRGIAEADPRKPLPFDHEPEYEAGGAFGKVYKVKIAPHCYRINNDMTNDTSKDLAFKKLEKEYAYKEEVKNIETLRRSLAPHAHIATHLAAIAHGDFLYIFHDYTDLGDLQVLLDGGTRYIVDDDDGTIGDVEKYDFDARFHNPLRSHFIEQLEKIAGALEHLHDRLPGITDNHEFCAHMDLKPNNILVRPAEWPNSPNVGKWVLTDFGISSFKKAEQSSESGSTFGHLLHLSRGTKRIGAGSQRAPEMHEKSAPRTKDGRLCDVWSFGCIINEVFAFILPGFEGGVQPALQSLKQFGIQKEITSREDIKQDYWFEHMSSDEGIRPSLKESVSSWLENRSNHKSYIGENIEETSEEPSKLVWVDSLPKLIFRILKIKPEERINAANIQRSLIKILKQVREFERSSHSAPSFTASTVFPPRLSVSEVAYPALSRTQGQSIPRHQISIPDPLNTKIEEIRGSHVIDFDISPDTKEAAWLYKAPSGTSIKLTNLRKNAIECDMCPDEVLPKDCDWTNIQLANGYMLVTGQKGIAKMGKVYRSGPRKGQSKPGTEVMIPEGWPKDCIKAVVSSEGFMAWEVLKQKNGKDNEILIWDGQSPRPFIRRDFDKGRGINSICFSADGQRLFGWTSGGGFNHVYMITLLTPEGNLPEGGIGRAVDQRMAMKRVSPGGHCCLPAQSLPVCVIREAEHHDSYFLSFGGPYRTHRVEHSVRRESGRREYALGNNVLAMVRKSWSFKWNQSKLQVFRQYFDTSPENSLASTERESFHPIYITGRTVKVAVCQEEQQESIIVCTDHGEAIKYYSKITRQDSMSENQETDHNEN